MEIFFLQYKSIPTQESDRFNEVGGAYINCWIKTDSIEAAKIIAERDIKENNWRVITLEDSSLAIKESYDEDDDALRYYEQAEIDGEVYVYHSWSNEADSDAQVH